MTMLSRRTALTSLFAATASAASAMILAAPGRADAPGSYDPPSSSRRETVGGLRAKLTPQDRAINRRCIDKTLSEAPTGKTWTWKNPRTGNGGSVTPTGRPELHAGQTCRNFTETITLRDGRSETISGRACRKADGSWQIAA